MQSLCKGEEAKVAQLVEHDLAKVGVAGSNPVFRSKWTVSATPTAHPTLTPTLNRRGGGIGRHARLKILWPSGRAGSSPAPGTILKFKGYAISSLVGNYIYVGISQNIEQRFKRHNGGYERTTAPYRPFKLI